MSNQVIKSRSAGYYYAERTPTNWVVRRSEDKKRIGNFIHDGLSYTFVPKQLPLGIWDLEEISDLLARVTRAPTE